MKRTYEWLAAAAGLVSLVMLAFTIIPETSKRADLALQVPRQDVEIDPRFTRIDEEVSKLKGQIDALSNTPQRAKFAVQLRGLNATLSDLKTRYSKLEEVISNNPARAIEVPLLRKDFDNLKDSQQQNTLALRQSVDQIYDLNKWLFGGVSLCIVGLALSVVLKGKQTVEA